MNAKPQDDRIERRGRKKRWHEHLVIGLQLGWKARIDAVLQEDEARLDFIRAAIKKELERREKAVRKKDKPGD